MINLISLTKLLVIFGIVYFILVTLFIQVLSILGFDQVSHLRIAFILGTVIEIILLYVFWSGWRKLWLKIPKLNSWIFPDLNGKWEAEIAWNWNNETGTKNGMAYIRQSIIKISVDLETDESESTTLLVKPFKDPESDQPAFYYMYRSETKSINNEIRSDHKGAAILKLSLTDNKLMSGNYFTDRKSYGRYTFRKCNTE